MHRRDLPWRRSRDPYGIWVSEIMLQQTRVAAVLLHYAEFLRRFPTVAALAAAPEADVLAAWSGLGYYRRARMLRLGAQAVVREHTSALPATAAELLTLPGIGAYTSAAIASIAFGEPVAVVDGNVERVMIRVAGLALSAAAGENSQDVASPPRIRELAGELLDRQHPGDFNQAMMELGALLCLPRKPLCRICPVRTLCETRGEHPAAPRKAMVVKQVACAMVVATLPQQGPRVLLQQRPVEAAIMPGMWELPEIAAGSDGVAAPDAPGARLIVRHAILQTNYVVHVYAMNAEELARQRLHQRTESWAAPEALSRMPLTGLARKVLRRVGWMPEPAA